MAMVVTGGTELLPFSIAVANSMGCAEAETENRARSATVARRILVGAISLGEMTMNCACKWGRID